MEHRDSEESITFSLSLKKQFRSDNDRSGSVLNAWDRVQIAARATRQPVDDTWKNGNNQERSL
jgi:hypothetical protein